MKWLKSWFLIPLLLTGGWLLVVAYLTCVRWEQFLAMPLNELGDFFAGVAAPLAFLWIVFGYLQHGNEIQDQALITSRLVEASEIQALATRNLATLTSYAQSRDDLEKAQSVQPLLDVHLGGWGAGGQSFYLTIKNDGMTAHRLKCSCEQASSAVLSGVTLESNKWVHLHLEFEVQPELPLRLTIRCTDTLNFVHIFEFTVEQGPPLPQIGLSTHRIFRDVTGFRTGIVDGNETLLELGASLND